MAGLRTSHGICPPEVIRFILDLFKYNDNTRNHYSDVYYRAALVDALGNSITPVVSVALRGTPITSDSLSADAKLVLEEVTRLLNMEKNLPSYKYMVSVSCLKVIRKLQKCGHLPSLPKIYRCYAAYGQYIDLRIAAMECLVDFVKTDPDPAARHALAQLLIDNPPFTRESRSSRLDRPELVERLWVNMNHKLAFDTKLRCDMVDLYHALYGTKRPLCLQSAEVSNMYKEIIKEGNKKANMPGSDVVSNNESKAPPPTKEDKDEVVDIVEEQIKNTVTPMKRTATEAFEVDNEIIKLETTEVVTVVEENDMKVESIENQTKIDVKEDVVEKAAVLSPEPKRLKSEIFEEDDNSVTIIDIGDTSLMKADSSFEANKTDADSRHKGENTTKQKKKKKDKKKHKHKHKHKHNKEKERDKERERKDKKDPSISRIQAKEATPETLSSADSSNSNSNPPTLNLT
ncbi:unnamed protein product [Ceratitis capitata]|uniref:(Mediterranean fruit fly) hypothetical protein n=1 Tax=Ceratitis capitata TaxID=7213 RepID=A0A811UXL3_CERCA|nr:unnamed protein product [Ceratitis capitata]